MRPHSLLALAVAFLGLTGEALANGYCGGGCFSCCPTTACQAPCVTRYRAERTTCYRTVSEVVYERQEQQCARTVYDTVWDEQQNTCYRNVCVRMEREVQTQVQRPVYETAEREERYTVNRPVWETSYRDCSYTVRKPVWETSTRECRRVVNRPVYETSEREVRRMVRRPVTEVVQQERCRTVMRPVTTCRTVQQDCGRWTMQKTCRPGPSLPRMVCDPCCGWRVAMVPGPPVATYRPVYEPNIARSRFPAPPGRRKSSASQCRCRFAGW